jgi:hypothetical protein
MKSWANDKSAFASPLKLPMAGSRRYYDGAIGILNELRKMRNAVIKMSNFVVGDFIFLKGEQVIAKYRVSKITEEGMTTLTLVLPKNDFNYRKEKTFEYKGTEYKVGYPLFKQGLRAYPFKPSYDLLWTAYFKKQELNFLV